MSSYHTDEDLAINSATTEEEKEKKYLLAIERYPESKWHILNQLAFVYRAMDKDDKALQCNYSVVNECTDANELTQAYYALADHYEEKKDYRLALSYMQRSLEADKTDTEAVGRIGNLYMKLKQYDKAKETFQQFLSMKNWDGNICEEEYYDSMAELYDETGEPEKAEECREILLNKSESETGKASRHIDMAEAYKREGKTEQAQEHYQKAVEHYQAQLDKTGTGIEEVKIGGGITWKNHDTDRFGLLEKIAYTYYIAGNKTEANAWYAKEIEAIEAWLSSPATDFNRGYYESHLPQLYRNIGEHKTAITLYEKLLKAPSRYQDITYYYRNLGYAYAAEKNYIKATECWLKMIELNAKSEEALRALASIYYEQKKYDIAKSYLERYIELYPEEDARVYSSLAFCHDQKGEPYTVLSYLRQALKVNKDSDRELSAAIQLAMGKIYWHQLKDGENAVASFRSMMALNPSPKQVSDAGATILVLSFSAEGSHLAMKFWEDFPVQETLAPQGARLTQQQIKELPYYHGRKPKDTGESLKWKKQVVSGFEDDLQNNPVYKDYFSKFSPESVKHFIHTYARYKEILISSGDAYMKEKEERQEDYLLRDANNIFDMILQKKLFNMQILWRAEKISIPEIQICYDFQFWSHAPYGSYIDCPFLEEVTPAEVELMKQFLADNNFSDNTKFWLHSWQDYEEFTQRNSDDDMEYMPDWYEFYDGRMGTGALLLLPDERGKKEAYYTNIYWDWKNKQPKDPPPPPSNQPPYVGDIFPNPDEYTKFMSAFENNYLNLLHKRYKEEFEFPDEFYSRDALWDAVTELEQAKVPVYVEGGMVWYEAVIKAAQQYKNARIAEKLDEVYQNYRMNRELLSGLPISTSDNSFVGRSGYDTNKKLFAERILKGRELNGEPADFNY